MVTSATLKSYARRSQQKLFVLIHDSQMYRECIVLRFITFKVRQHEKFTDELYFLKVGETEQVFHLTCKLAASWR